ncbi:MAG: molybdate transport system ATP-binding protein [Solirubrobacteraceae bacterium]|nr:molybdate transport system ATP-binding protein [Solirubrobacteraceae bacterium]
MLQAIAGLRRPDSGRIALGAQPWFDRAARVDLPPERRSVGLVFQEYALFPHMSVRANVAFGGPARVDELLERFGIAHLAGVRPTAISGGERQRVALARALARNPGVLLLDEPLSALDAHTRTMVRGELEDVLAELALPALIVTHDVRDAIALADRIGVIVDGELRQLAPYAELARAPADAFVARLVGANVIPGDAVVGGGPGRDGVAVVAHPWELTLAVDRPEGAAAVPGVVHGVVPEGDRSRVRVGDVVVQAPAGEVERLGLHRGAPAWAVLAPGPPRVVDL